jgi:hypothetical protein
MRRSAIWASTGTLSELHGRATPFVLSVGEFDFHKNLVADPSGGLSETAASLIANRSMQAASTA